MSERRAGFEALAAAADGLARACATACAARVIELPDAAPLAAELRRSFGAAMATPADMQRLVGRAK